MAKKAKIIIGAAAAAAAIGAAIVAAREIKKRGYDKKAVKLLKQWSVKLKKEASSLEKKAVKEYNKVKKSKKKK